VDALDLDPQHPSLYIYTRALAEEKFLVTLNFSTNKIEYALPDGLKTTELMLGNLGSKEEHTSTIRLEPWEANIYRL